MYPCNKNTTSVWVQAVRDQEETGRIEPLTIQGALNANHHDNKRLPGKRQNKDTFDFAASSVSRN